MEGEMMHVIKYYMGGEISNFIKVWLCVYTSLSYCYVVAKIVPKRITRLLAFLPITCLFLFLPLTLHSMHLGGITSFFVAWLANFKILMLAFNKGPLSRPLLSLPHFIAVGCLPIAIQPGQFSTQNSYSVQLSSPKDDSTDKRKTPKEKAETIIQKDHEISKRSGKSLLIYAIKGMFLALFAKIYFNSDHIHPKIILIIYGFNIYFSLELQLAIAAALAHGLLRVELEPQFNEPLLSTSLQDFWGRRWNLMVTRILRPAVYDPIQKLSTKILAHQTWAKLPAIMATFVVSGIMHELIFYYLGRAKPTWEITCFFLLHGVCLMAEVAMKVVVRDKIKLPRIVGTILTVGFIIATGFWLFFPQLLRCKVDVKAFEEYATMAAFFKDLAEAFPTSTSLTSSFSKILPRPLPHQHL